MGLDQSAKNWIVENLAYRQSLTPLPLLDGWLTIVHSHNSGAVFGMLPEANMLFIVIAIIVVVVIVIYYRYLAMDSLLMRACLGLLLGGALGNLIDRLRYGYVIDFVDVGIPSSIRWYTFNVADASIFTGVCVLAYYLLIARSETLRSSQPANERINDS